MSELIAVAKLLAQAEGTARRITRERPFPISGKPLVLVPIVMAGESPALFGIGVGDGRGATQIFTCPNPVNRDEQYAMLADALRAMELAIQSWEGPAEEVPQIVVTGGDSARLALGLIDRSVYSKRPELVVTGRRLAWFDKRSDSPDSASMLVLPTALAQCFATGQDEFADQHLGAFLEWCAPADGRIGARVTAAEQLPASGATSPEFDRDDLEPATDRYGAAMRDGDTGAAARARKEVENLIVGEITRRYRLAQAALCLLRGFPESAVAQEMAAEDRRSFLDHLAYVADPNNHLRRDLPRNVQTSEFMTREFAVDRIAGVGVRSVSRAYEAARLAGDLLEGEVIASSRVKNGRRTDTRQTIASTQHLSLRAGDKLELLRDPRFVYRVEEVGLCRQTGRTLVRIEVIHGKTLLDLPAEGDVVVLATPLRDRFALGRARGIAWDRMRAMPAPAAIGAAVQATQDLAGMVAALQGKK